MKCPRCLGSGEIDDAQAHIGDMLRQVRSDKGFTQEQVAEKAGISRAQIANIESGRSDIPLKRLQKLAAALDCRMRDLVP